MIIKIFFLLAALKLFDVNEKPMPASVLYTVAFFLGAFISGVGFVSAAIFTVVVFCVSLVYFSLLAKFDSGWQYYATMLLGGGFLVFVL